MPIWVALIGLASGAIGHSIGVNQAAGPIVNTSEGEALNRIRGDFVGVRPGPDGKTLVCTGTYANLTPGEHPLWLAVEVGGHIWFKDGRIDFDINRQTWTATISEPGLPKPFSVLLFAVTQEANREILRWLNRGRSDNGNYQEMTNMHGTIRLDHFDGAMMANHP